MKDKQLKSYLTFRLKGELFAIGVDKVLEIIETSEDHSVTNLPKAPDAVEGVVNFRGNVIPVINMRQKFDLANYEEQERFVIMVLNLTLSDEDQIIGAMSDKVVDVIEIAETEIQPVPEVGKGYNSDYVSGVVYRHEEFVMVLDVEAAIDTDEIIQLKQEEEVVETEEDKASEAE
ncbi:chemotaxis protein CheW [Carboxylicivirga marina]|uniref:Purine-binding chemotaxis protein CheW n=1 Tax=Carboxylicivirga marina TaxID=2800988 RepID=A0ABS1HGU2_9BACT|nr:chemotaxis protein CheW [Carboxylicivirga marina]MBK3516893.1 purine-binding chemotaxis protein CheW [Carboxylicivirga marina]